MSRGIAMIVSDFEPPKEPALKKQSRYGSPWKPGEIPTRGTLRPVIGPLDLPHHAYGERMGIEPPTSRGKAKLKAGKFSDE